MKVALLELRRRPGRFAAATVILTLLAALLLLLGGLLDGLTASSTSALAAQPGDLVVYSADARETLDASRLDPKTRERIEAVDGVSDAGGLGVTQMGARVPGNEPRDLAAVALFGYEIAPDGVPEPPGDGEAYADRSLEAAGVAEGATLRLGPARTPIRVIGWVEDRSYGGSGSLWATADTWRKAVEDNRPGAAVGDGGFQALVVEADAGTDVTELADRIDDATDGATETLDLATAVESVPGVAEQRRTFDQIIAVTVVIAVVVVALFFALLTVERLPLYGVLKAIGATSSRLLSGVLLQAIVVTAVASVIGTLVAIVFDLAVPAGSIPFRLGPDRILSSIGLLLAAAVIGSAFSLRRVLRVDPASAIGRTT